MAIHSSKSQDDENKDSKSSYFSLPALDVSIAFPQATPASIFPPCTSDYYHFNDLLTPAEQALRLRVRECVEKEVAPIMTKYWEKAEFPFEIVPKLGALNIAGGTIKGYGCPGLSVTANAIVTAEIARVDASCSTFILVHSSLAMLTISLCGSELQKQKYLPSLAKLDTIACWGLTEPDYGSDASSVRTTATKVDGGWVLEGQKRWIGNSTFADILVIFAKNKETNQINGFIVKKNAPGLQATKIENKIGLRMVQNGDILLQKVFVPDEDRLPGVNSFQDTSKVLAVSRVMVAWQPIGITMGVYDMCHRYLLERKQFGAPLAAFQINQQRLVQMLSNIQAMLLMGWRLCKLYEAGKMTPGQASLGKSWITLRARETVALGRELLGGNGILSDFLVAKAFGDLEPIYTYEGTYDINTLVTGREITDVDFRNLVNRVPKGASLTIVSDSCHSGGLIDKEKEQIGPSSLPSDHAPTLDHITKSKTIPFESILHHLSSSTHINTPDLGTHLLELFGAAASLSFSLPSHELHSFPSAHTDTGILLSGCQANESCADISPNGNGEKAYGAFSNAIQNVLNENLKCDLSNKEIVLMARKVLEKQGFGQHPCLYSSDDHANSTFLNHLSK